MTVSTAKTIFMMAAVIDFVGIFTLFGVMLYIAKNKIDIILDSLQNSRISASLKHYGAEARGANTYDRGSLRHSVETQIPHSKRLIKRTEH